MSLIFHKLRGEKKMKCQKCGTDNPDSQVICKVCGAVLAPAAVQEAASSEVKYRSRWLALLCAWLGFGLYELYLLDAEAAAERMKYSIKAILLCMVLIGILMVPKLMFWVLRDIGAVLFKKELYDANGNPVVWSKRNA